jgi:hypothetical protein
MPKYNGGDLLEITCNHPTLGNFTFATKANESYTLDPGGKRSADDASMITGNGAMIDQVNNVRWSFEGPLMADFDSGNEIENLPKLAEASELGTWTFAHISGVIWRGRGKFVGDLAVDTNTAQLTAKIAGSNKLEKL